MSAKLDRAVFNLVQSIRTSFADNVNQTFANEWKTLSPVQQRLVLSLLEDALQKGSEQATPWLKETYQRELETNSAQVNIPDGLFDAAIELSARPRRDFAAFTIVRNEPFFLDLWCDYYSRAFGEDNLFLLDNSTDDGSVERAKARFPLINVVSVPSRDSLNWLWCTNVVKQFQRILFRGYHVVAFADADEYLVPEQETLRDFCEQFLTSERDYVRATGWGVVQQVDSEAPASNAHVLADRHQAWRTTSYDKTLLSKISLDWAKGSHTIYRDGKKLNDTPDPTLALVHLRDVDIDVFTRQAVERQRLNPTAASAHGSTDPSQIRKYFGTRIPPWNPECREYTLESRTVSDHWRTSLKRVTEHST